MKKKRPHVRARARWFKSAPGPSASTGRSKTGPETGHRRLGVGSAGDLGRLTHLAERVHVHERVHARREHVIPQRLQLNRLERARARVRVRARVRPRARLELVSPVPVQVDPDAVVSARGGGGGGR